MFSGFMMNAWIASSIVAVIAGVVGFFVVLRGESFAAHAIPNGAFAGAAGATLLGFSTLIGLAAAAMLTAFGIGSLSRHGRRDAVTALTLVVMLALGSALLSRTSEYAPELFSLLFGQVLGVSTAQIWPVAVLGAICLAVVATCARPLLYASVLPEMAEARGIRRGWIEAAFLFVLALSTAMTVPVVGALLIFSLMIGPPAAARAVVVRPAPAIAASVAASVATVWVAIAFSYLTNWPIGFFVGALSALCYAIGLLVRRWQGAFGRIAPPAEAIGALDPRP